jgi:hypothetical protein
MVTDGVPITIEVDGNYLLIPTKEGIEKVCISEFDVEVVDNELLLVHEVNPKIIISIGTSLLVSELLKEILRRATGQTICFWCSIQISATGLAMIPIVKKLAGANPPTTTNFEHFVIAVVATSTYGLIARSITAIVNIIGLCNCKNCLFHPTNH